LSPTFVSSAFGRGGGGVASGPPPFVMGSRAGGALSPTLVSSAFGVLDVSPLPFSDV
jgi:hypothetical protein